MLGCVEVVNVACCVCSRLKASSIMSEGRSGARSVRCGYIGIVLNECVAQTGDSQ